jgi:hypothetical protein
VFRYGSKATYGVINVLGNGWLYIYKNFTNYFMGGIGSSSTSSYSTISSTGGSGGVTVTSTSTYSTSVQNVEMPRGAKIMASVEGAIFGFKVIKWFLDRILDGGKAGQTNESKREAPRKRSRTNTKKRK